MPSKFRPDIYSYADSIQRQMAIDRVRVPKQSPFRGQQTMKNTLGRDNKMYYVSDGFNLDTSVENQFTSLLALKDIQQPLYKGKASSSLFNQSSPFSKATLKTKHSDATRNGSKLKYSTLDPGMSSAKHKYSLAMSSGLAISPTEMTSAQSRPFIGRATSTLSPHEPDRMKSLVSMELLTEPEKSRPSSQVEGPPDGERLASQQLNQPNVGTHGGDLSTSNGLSPMGQMLDSDGFHVEQMDAVDFDDLTLEEKILCGFYRSTTPVHQPYQLQLQQ